MSEPRTEAGRPLTDAEVFLSLSFWRNEPLWDEEGMANFDTYVNGVGTTEHIAKGFAASCSERPMRWFRTKQYGSAIGMHRGEGERHFHVIRSMRVLAELNRYGQPTGREPSRSTPSAGSTRLREALERMMLAADGAAESGDEGADRRWDAALAALRTALSVEERP
jgi:hypothetical protein